MAIEKNKLKGPEATSKKGVPEMVCTVAEL